MSTWKEAAILDDNGRIDRNAGVVFDGTVIPASCTGFFDYNNGVNRTFGADKGGLAKELFNGFGNRDFASSAENTNNQTFVYASRTEPADLFDFTDPAYLNYGIGPGNLGTSSVIEPGIFSVILPTFNNVGETGTFGAADWTASFNFAMVDGDVEIAEFVADDNGQPTAETCVWEAAQLTWEVSGTTTALGSNAAVAVESGGTITLAGGGTATVPSNECWFYGSLLTMNSGGDIETNLDYFLELGSFDNDSGLYDTRAGIYITANDKSDKHAVTNKYWTPYMFTNDDGITAMVTEEEIDAKFVYVGQAGRSMFDTSLPAYVTIDNFVIDVANDTPTTGCTYSNGTAFMIADVVIPSYTDKYIVCKENASPIPGFGSVEKFLIKDFDVPHGLNYIEWWLQGDYTLGTVGDPDRVVFQIRGIDDAGNTHTFHPSDDIMTPDYSETARVMGEMLYQMYATESVLRVVHEDSINNTPGGWYANTMFDSFIAGGVIYGPSSTAIGDNYGLQYRRYLSSNMNGNVHVHTNDSWKSRDAVIRSTKLADPSGANDAAMTVHNADPTDATVGSKGELYLTTTGGVDKIFICTNPETV